MYKVFFFSNGLECATYIKASCADEALAKARKIDHRYVGVQKVEED